MSNPNTPDPTPPNGLPSFESLRASDQDVLPSDAGHRLSWSLNAPLESAISIMPSRRSSDPASSLEPYRNPSSSPDDDVWHPLSQQPITEPPVSSIRVGVYQFSDWEEFWTEAHSEHVGDEFEHVDANGVEIGRRVERLHGEEAEKGGDLNEVGEDGEEYPAKLLACCGMWRPKPPPGETVMVTAGKTGFVSVHDYLTTVHPWLMERKGDLCWAMDAFDEEPFPIDTDFKVDLYRVNTLMIKEN